MISSKLLHFFAHIWGKINIYITFIERKKHACYIVPKLIQGADVNKADTNYIYMQIFERRISNPLLQVCRALSGGGSQSDCVH